MSLEQALLAHAEALNTHSAALNAYAAALGASGGTAPVVSTKADAVDASEKKEAAADTKKTAAAEKKPTAAEKKAAEKKAADAKKASEITDARLTEVFGPLLAKDQDEEVIAANKAFVASVNAHFGVTKLRELTSQEDRAKAVEWGLARAEDADFEIPSDNDSDDDNGV